MKKLLLSCFFATLLLHSACKKDNYECTYTEVKDGITYTATVSLEKRSKKDIKAYEDKKYTCIIK